MDPKTYCSNAPTEPDAVGYTARAPSLPDYHG